MLVCGGWCVWRTIRMQAKNKKKTKKSIKCKFDACDSLRENHLQKLHRTKSTFIDLATFHAEQLEYVVRQFAHMPALLWLNFNGKCVSRQSRTNGHIQKGRIREEKTVFKVQIVGRCRFPLVRSQIIQPLLEGALVCDSHTSQQWSFRVMCTE